MRRDRMVPELTPPCGAAPRRRRRAAAAIPSAPASAPASTRIMSSRLATSRPMRCDSWTMVVASSRRAAGSGSVSCSRVLAAPSIEASGVRMSCESELRSAVRSRSASTSTSDSRLRSASASRSNATAVCPASDSSRRRRAGSRKSAAPASGSPEHAHRPPRRRERQVERARGRQRRRPASRRLVVIEAPLRHGPLPLVERIRRLPDRGHRVRLARAAGRPRRARTCRAGSGAPRRPPRRRSRAVASSRLSPYSAEVRCSRSRAASAWFRIRPVRLPITSATTSMTPNVSTYRTSDTEKV